MPQMPNGMPGMPQMPNGMPGMQQPGMPGMQRPGMPETTPGDGNMYPSMPGMPNGMPPMTCEQLRDMMIRMNCPMNGNTTNAPRTVVPPENGTATPPANNNR
jgi:hypothetical protein